MKKYFLLSMIFAFQCVHSAQAQSPAHPMDPLTAKEYAAIVSLLKAEGHATPSTLYPLITLHEPNKDAFYNLDMEGPHPRPAFVIAKNKNQVFEAIIDLAKHEIRSFKEVKGVQPNILLQDEWSFAQRLVMAHPDWQKAMNKRGYDSFRGIVCMPHTTGIAYPKARSARLLNISCYDNNETSNFWGRPIEGLLVIVNLDQGKVRKIIDTGAVAMPKPSHGKFDTSNRQPAKPSADSGPGYSIDHQEIAWEKWRFHFRLDPRLGLIVSDVKFKDRGRWRSILYQGSLSEVFVPYMDPDEGWHFKTYMDAGEYGMGKLASELELGRDCPADAAYFDAVFADDYGKPFTKARAACLFERDAGDIAWRHYDAINKITRSEPQIDLVLRMISTVGNYDYVFDWVFKQNASIKIAVGATGIDQVKAVNSATVKGARKSADAQFGHMVAPHTVAVNHDHFFSFRLDLDVDGRKNSFLKEKLVAQDIETKHGQRGLWQTQEHIIQREKEAKMRVNIYQPSLWRVINPDEMGRTGYPSSYHIKPKGTGATLLKPDDPLLKRAAFIQNHLWITAYDQNEIYAAGLYPNQSGAGQGLPVWSSDNQPIEQTDIVAWYTMGFHHVVRTEDWPVLPTAWHELELRPFHFFDKNPALIP